MDKRVIYMYDSKGNREYIGFITHRMKHGDKLGTVTFKDSRFNKLFPRITTVISSNWDYNLIRQDMISVITGMYDNLRMSCFIKHRK